MGRKTHGPYLVAAIEYNDITKVSDILTTKFRDKSKVKHFLVSEVRRLASEYTEVPLLLAATLDDPTILKYFVTKHDCNINHVHEYGFQKPKKRKTALLVAVRRGLYTMVDTILALNGDVNVQDHKGRTPLHHAVRRADYRMAKLLLSRGAQVSIQDMSGNTPLHIATIFGHMELVRLLLRQGGDLYKKGQYGAIPIHIAAKEGHASLVRMFVEQYEVNVNIKVPCYDDREKAPMHVAAMEGHSETVFTLLEHCRADVNIRDSEGETPLHCVALREYDPLGMKSKEDFTETVKVLLNYGAEANARNARGETALHLAARNEFQKVLEVLVLAGTDPLIEDDDKNKAIDLVAPEDTVSKQTLKNAMADREKYMAEALEVRARGFAMNLQNHLPFANRSQSTMNMPLAGMHSAQSHSRLYPNQGSTFGSNYFPHGGSSRQVFGGQFHQSSHSHSSSSSSKRRSKESIQSVPKLPPSMLTSYDQRPPVPLSAVRKAKSVEELDQVAGGFYPKPGGVSQSGRKKQGRHGRKNSYQESETTSFWSVTPPGSVREEESDRDSRHAMKHRKAKSVPKLAHERRLVESDEELDDRAKKTKQKKPDVPMKFLAPKDIDSKSLGGDESDYFLDDDDSVDALEIRRHDKKKKTKEPKPFKTQKPAQLELKPGLSSWLDEQAKLVKTTAGPVAHSTPPQGRKTRQNHDDDDDESSSEDSSTSDSESDDTAVPKTAKSKPLPPPKPVKNSVTRMGVPVLPSKPLTGSKESLNPRSQRYQKENPDIERVIQLEVDDSYNPGETLIRVIPINPAGPSKVHTINQGTSSTTFLRLQGDASGSVSSEQVEINDGQSRKKDRRKPEDHAASEVKTKTSGGTPSKSTSQDPRGHNKSKNSIDSNLVEKDKRPVPKPRESRTASVTAPSSGSKDKASHRHQQDSASDSSSASSDEAALVTPASRSGVPGKPEHGRSSPFTQSPKQEQSSNRKAGLVFQKAGVTSDDSNFHQKSPGESSTVSTLENGKGRSKQSSKGSRAKAEVSHQKHAGTKPSKNDLSNRKSGASSQQHESDEEETESSEEEESEDEEDGDAKAEATASQDLRTINLNSDGNLSYTLVGGNVDGVFVHALDRTSEAAKNDLRCGDQILKANDQLVLGRTREEAMQMLRSITGPMSLVVRRMPQKYRAAVKNEGMTDLLFVRAHFSSESSKKGELAVREGDIFCVSDTFPDGNVGFWKAQKVNSKAEENPTGFIPNRAKADQITVKQQLAQGKAAPDQRGGAFLRSFRRAKSADRNSRGHDDDDKLLSSGSVVSYEKVSQRISNIRRPIVILGLFCDTVVNMLAKDSPDLFETAGGDVENLKDSENPVNVRLIQASMNRGKHCLMILAPPSIEYLQQKTDINPITVYLSPVSKAMVKTVKAKLAPFYNKNTSYMYEEATRFEKNYSHLFTASIPYTGDDWWFFNLKEAITRIQNQPVFQPVNLEELEVRIAAEMNKILPQPITRHPQGQVRSSRDRTARMSRTTDDLPVTPVKVESNLSSDTSSVATSGGPRSIMKQQQQRPLAESISSEQDQPVSLTFHRLHSHNFDDMKSGNKKRTQAVIQSHETPL